GPSRWRWKSLKPLRNTINARESLPPCECLLNHSALRLLNKPDQHGHVLALVAFALQLFQSLRGVQFGIHQHPEGVLNSFYPFFAEASPLQAYRVRAEHFHIARLHAL